MNKLLFATILISACFAHAEEKTVFKSKDASGTTTFSDQATESAEEIVIESPQTFKAQPPSTVFSPKETVRKVKTGPAYEILQITNPEHDSAIRNNAGNLTVSFQLKPSLQPNHSVQLIVDGSPGDSKKSIGPFMLTNLDRGTHQFQVVIIEDQSGEILQSSNSVATTILRVSVINRAN
jgi:hypothetical protein